VTDEDLEYDKEMLWILHITMYNLYWYIHTIMRLVWPVLNGMAVCHAACVWVNTQHDYHCIVLADMINKFF
jgi:hypothetical protein